VRIRVGHLYPDYLNIYADRGNIAVLERRAVLRGHELDVEAVSIGDALRPDAYDLLYIGGGQDREQALVAGDLVAKSHAVHAAIAEGVAALAVCGGYQLLGDYYRDRDGTELPGIGVFPLHTIAGFENHAGRTKLDPGATPLGRVVSGFGNDGESGHEGARVGRAIGTYLHGPLLPRNPWLADWLLAQALGHASGGEAPELTPLADDLEREAHTVAAARARSRGGRY
jgi:CobQ-like glutamine amidotransferase family enzyme